MMGINGKSPPPPPHPLTCIPAAINVRHPHAKTIMDVLSWTCRSDQRVNRLAENQPSQMANCGIERYQMLWSLRHYPRPKAMDGTPFLESRGVERGSARRRRSSLKGNHQSVRSALKLFQKQHCANFKRQGGTRITGFPIPSRTELYKLNCMN